MKSASLKFATEIIRGSRYATIATACEDGQPWNTPVAIFHDNIKVLYWVSWTESQHSLNIERNNRAFIVLYDSSIHNTEAWGVYIRAEASRLDTLQEIKGVTQLFKDDPYLSVDPIEFLGSKPRRVYRATADTIWMNDEAEIDGNYIDKRKQVWP